MILSINPYLFLGISVIVLLIALFFITYFLNKKTPVPKGCENLSISEENCMGCANSECRIKQKIELKNLEEELKEDK